MFINYEKDNSISGVKKQHNIMIFIGNGFDISILSRYRQDKLISSYSKFYDYLCYKGFNADNVLFSKLTADKKNGKENWSDFENSLGELIKNGVAPIALNDALKEIQNMFLIFLNEIVNPEVLLKVSKDAETNKWGINALSKFLGDLCEDDYKKISFPENTDHYHMYNYLFVNFNYTSLFDNYIFLDKNQFDPIPHKTVDTNFTFYPNPNNHEKFGMNGDTRWSSFIMTNTIHPHGYQNIPRSLLFGIEDNEYTSHKELKRFNKSYWAQNHQKYKNYFDDAELFVIYGTSIGETDSWWWKNICDSLLTKDSELIIYYYHCNNFDKESIKELFINASKIKATQEDIMQLKEKIYVIFYDDSKSLNMFSFCKQE